MRSSWCSVVLLVACNDAPPGSEDPVFERTDCDPLDPSVCLLPFPNDHFLADDPSTGTGFRGSVGPEAAPENRDGVQIDPTYWNEKDGFSVNAQPMAWFDGLSAEGLIPWSDIGTYLDPDARTVIVDTVTGERVPHFAELDLTVEQREHASLMMRPAQPFVHARRYVVGLQGLVKDDGSPVDVSDAFAALRDGTATEDGDVEYRRERYDVEVFPVLEAAGVSRSDLQLAWDFTTMSEDSSIGRMIWMKEDAVARYGDAGPPFTIDSIEEEDCAAGARIARTVYATVTVPYYTEVDEPGSFLTRDADGMPFYNGDAPAELMVRIPCSVAADPRPVPVLHYGHGLLGDYSEARTGYLSEMADEFGFVVLAMNWTGMSEEDVDEIVWMTVDDPSRFAFLPERSMQGFVELIGGLSALQGDLGQDAALAFPDDEGTLVSVVDPETAYYYGNSQGGVLGGAYLALSPAIERGVLGVAGTPYALLLGRSTDFDPYFLLFKAKFPDGREISLVVNNFMQMLWDAGESAGYTHRIAGEPLSGNPEKQVLVQVAYGDPQVSTLGARYLARAVGAKHVAPHEEVFGLEEATLPLSGSGYVEWWYEDGPTIPEEGLPPEGLDPHECPRREPEAQQQLWTFLTTGEVVDACGGPCSGSIAETCPND